MLDVARLAYWHTVGRGPLPGVPVSSIQYSHRTGQNGLKMAQKDPLDPPKGSGTTFERSHFRPVLGQRWTPSRSRLEMGVKKGPKWPKTVRLTLPKCRGPRLKFSIFDRFWAHLSWMSVGGRWRLAAVDGCRLAVAGGWQLMAVGDCWLAVGSCQVGNGGAPSARHQQAHLTRGSPDPFWVILGNSGPGRGCHSERLPG